MLLYTANDSLRIGNKTGWSWIMSVLSLSCFLFRVGICYSGERDLVKKLSELKVFCHS